MGNLEEESKSNRSGEGVEGIKLPLSSFPFRMPFSFLFVQFWLSFSAQLTRLKDTQVQKLTSRCLCIPQEAR